MLAAAPAAELGLLLLAKDEIKEALTDRLALRRFRWQHTWRSRPGSQAPQRRRPDWSWLTVIVRMRASLSARWMISASHPANGVP
jgi:hypothetical protein